MTVLRVALDARCLQDEPLGGVGRSTRAVIEALRDDVAFMLFTDDRGPVIDTDLPQRALHCPLPTKAMWLQLAVPPALRGFPGVFHCPWYGLPFRQPVPMVVTIYDLTFEHGAPGFTIPQRWAYRVQARWAARRAAHVLTGSEAVRRELGDRYRVPLERVAVQPSPLDRAVLQTDVSTERALREQFGLGGRYAVALGGATRRRLDLVFAAWPIVRARIPDATLLVVGDADPPALPEGAVSAGRVDDAHWAAALAGADVLLYPTQFEGFGYPALEAMALGTPVVCARVGSLPEVVGDAGYWLPALTSDAVAAAAIDVLTDAALASRLSQAGRTQAAHASDLSGLRATVLHAYEQAARSRPKS